MVTVLCLHHSAYCDTDKPKIAETDSAMTYMELCRVASFSKTQEFKITFCRHSSNEYSFLFYFLIYVLDALKSAIRVKFQA